MKLLSPEGHPLPLAAESASAGRAVAQGTLLDIAATDEWTDLQQAAMSM